MKYLISGASSIFAQAVAEKLVSQGNEVCLIGRKMPVPFYLENPEKCLEHFLNTSDFFLHFAHSFDSQTKPDLNEIAARKILVKTENSNITKCVYISSDSASANTKSLYGQSKYRTEKVFLPSKKWVVIRIGVIGDDMIPSPYQILRKFVKMTKILIIPNPYKPNLTITNVDQVVVSLVNACRSKFTGGPFSVQPKPELISLVDLLRKKDIKPRMILKVPNYVAFCGWYIGKRFKFTRQIADSIMTTLVDRESIGGVPR